MLAWIVAGAVAWHRDGLGACSEVDEVTAEWRRAEDVIEAWWADCIEALPTAQAAASSLYASFKWWCETNGRRPPSNKEFAKRLTDHHLYDKHQIAKQSKAAGNIYTGLCIRPGPIL
jgi:phage/plasmid-associated DNA primase